MGEGRGPGGTATTSAPAGSAHRWAQWHQPRRPPGARMTQGARPPRCPLTASFILQRLPSHDLKRVLERQLQSTRRIPCDGQGAA